MPAWTTLEIAKDFKEAEKASPDEPVDMASWKVSALADAVIALAKASEFAWFSAAEVRDSDLKKLRKTLKEIGANSPD